MRRAHIFLPTLFAFSFLVFLSSIANSQRSPERASTAVDEILVDVAGPGSPGCAVAVARDSKLSCSRGQR